MSVENSQPAFRAHKVYPSYYGTRQLAVMNWYREGVPFEKNAFEGILEERYRQAQELGGPKTSEGWETLTGKNAAESQVNVVMPVFIEPGIHDTLDSVISTHRPREATLNICVVLDGSDDRTQDSVYDFGKGLVVDNWLEEQRLNPPSTDVQRSSNLSMLEKRLFDFQNDATKPACHVSARGVNVTIVRQENSGKVAAIKKGLEVLDVEDIISIDGDTIIQPNAISLLYAAMERFPELPAVSGEVSPRSTNHVSDRGRNAFARAGLPLDRRFHGPIFAVRRAFFENIPDSVKREDYFIEQMLLRDDMPLVTIQSAYAHTHHPRTIRDIVLNSRGLEYDGKRVRKLLGIDFELKGDLDKPITDRTTTKEKFLTARKLAREDIFALVWSAWIKSVLAGDGYFRNVLPRSQQRADWGVLPSTKGYSNE